MLGQVQDLGTLRGFKAGAECSYLLCGWLESAGSHSFRVECPQLGTPPPPPSQEVKESGKLSRNLSRSPPLSYPLVHSPSLPAGPKIRGHQLSPSLDKSTHESDSHLLQAAMGEAQENLTTRPSPHPRPRGKEDKQVFPGQFLRLGYPTSQSQTTNTNSPANL